MDDLRNFIKIAPLRVCRVKIRVYTKVFKIERTDPIVHPLSPPAIQLAAP